MTPLIKYARARAREGVIPRRRWWRSRWGGVPASASAPSRAHSPSSDAPPSPPPFSSSVYRVATWLFCPSAEGNLLRGFPVGQTVGEASLHPIPAKRAWLRLCRRSDAASVLALCRRSEGYEGYQTGAPCFCLCRRSDAASVLMLCREKKKPPRVTRGWHASSFGRTIGYTIIAQRDRACQALFFRTAMRRIFLPTLQGSSLACGQRLACATASRHHRCLRS